MQMFEEDGGFVFELSDNEVDAIFEEFSMNGLCYQDIQARVRFIKAEKHEWLTRMCGPQGDAWWYSQNEDLRKPELWFAQSKHAAAFKLMHGF